MSGLPCSPQMVGHNAMDLVVFLQIHLLKSCPLSVTVYGTCEEVLKIKWGHNVGPWSCRAGALVRSGGDPRTLSFHHVRTQWEGGHCKSGGEFSLSLNWPATWSWTSRTMRNNFILLSHPVCGILIWQPEQIKTCKHFLFFFPFPPLLFPSLSSSSYLPFLLSFIE